jgi:hypothetical protein
VHVRPTEKMFLMVVFLCVFFRWYTVRNIKYFSDSIRIFLCVFAHTEECEFPVVCSCGVQGPNDRSCFSIIFAGHQEGDIAISSPTRLSSVLPAASVVALLVVCLGIVGYNTKNLVHVHLVIST